MPIYNKNTTFVCLFTQMTHVLVSITSVFASQATHGAFVEGLSADAGFVVETRRSALDPGSVESTEWEAYLAAASAERRAQSSTARRPALGRPPSGGNSPLGGPRTAGSLAEQGDLWSSQSGAFVAAGAEVDSRGSALSLVTEGMSGEAASGHRFERHPHLTAQQLMDIRTDEGHQEKDAASGLQSSRSRQGFRAWTRKARTSSAGLSAASRPTLGGVEVSPVRVEGFSEMFRPVPGVGGAPPALPCERGDNQPIAPVAAGPERSSDETQRQRPSRRRRNALRPDSEEMRIALVAARAHEKTVDAGLMRGGAGEGSSDDEEDDDSEDALQPGRCSPTEEARENRALIEAALAAEHERREAGDLPIQSRYVDMSASSQKAQFVRNLLREAGPEGLVATGGFHIETDRH